MNVITKGKGSAVLAATLLLCTAVVTQGVSASNPVAEAARDGNLEQARQHIAAGVDVNLPQPDGTTPLLWAVYNTDTDLVQLLLDAGADPNLANNLDISPLLQASRYGNVAMINALLGSGASLDATSLAVESPLIAASRSGNPDAVMALLDAGANPNTIEPTNHQTPLMWAAAEGHLDVARVLLEAGADPNMQARVNELEKRKNADFPSGGFAALHWASRNGNTAMIDLLLDHGADINIKNGDNSSPMMLAIVNDRLDLAASLLDEGADPNDGSLYYATIMRDATTDWRARDGTVFRADHPNDLTALDLTRILLDAGADPNRPFIGQMHNTSMCCDTKSNETPFYRASKAADIAGMTMMVEHGGDPNWKPASETRQVGIDGEEEIVSRTALMVAITGGKGVGVAGGPNDLRYGPPPFREPGNRDPAEAVALLLEAGADPNVPGPDSLTALHVAVKELDPDIVRALVAHGADMDAKNKDDKTVLEVAQSMEPPKATPGFYFEEPKMQPVEMAALLRDLAGARANQ